MYLLITYDISSDKRRRKIDKLLSSYGDRVNYSVFELDIKKHLFDTIVFKLSKFMGEHDSIRIYKLNKNIIENAIELNEKRPNPFEKEASYV